MEMKRRQQWAIAILGIFYTVGIFAILANLHPDFILLTPFQLLLSLFLLMWCHRPWDSQTYLFLLLCYIIGFGIELAGVQTGIIFGSYTYGPVLGPKILGTPLMIGINWILVTYAAGTVVNQLLPKLHLTMKVIIAALLMVGLDLLIEPVAMAYNFWAWEGGHIPVQNYFAWFVIATITCSLFYILAARQTNKVGSALFSMQFLFFLLLYLFGQQNIIH